MAAASPDSEPENGEWHPGQRREITEEFVMGRKARRAESFWPSRRRQEYQSHRQQNPQVTRNNDVTLSLSSLPVAISTPKAAHHRQRRRERTPVENAALQTTVQTTMKIAATSAGSRRARTVFLSLSVEPSSGRPVPRLDGSTRRTARRAIALEQTNPKK